MSLNLHQIVRGAISSVNADEQVYIIRSTGNANVKGRIQATYATPELITAQVQTLSNDDLKIVNETERTERDHIEFTGDLSVYHIRQTAHCQDHRSRGIVIRTVCIEINMQIYRDQNDAEHTEQIGNGQDLFFPVFNEH